MRANTKRKIRFYVSPEDDHLVIGIRVVMLIQ